MEFEFGGTPFDAGRAEPGSNSPYDTWSPHLKVANWSTPTLVIHGAKDYRLVETNHTLALSHLHQRLSRRSLVVVFSDFVDTTTAELLIENVQMLNRHHVVVFVSLRDPLLAAYHHKSVNSLAMVSEVAAAADLERERRRVLNRLSRLGVFVIETAPGGLRPELISTYLSIRSRELI